MSVVRFFKYLLPHWFFILKQQRNHGVRKKNPLRYQLKVDSIKTNFERKHNQVSGEPYGFDSSLQYLSSLGLDQNQILLGSIPEQHLNFIIQYLTSYFGSITLRGIHIGNFLGVSLCHLGHWMKNQSHQSVLIAIDPNLNHRGIDRCNEIAMDLVQHFGLSDHIINVVGYSMWKSISNDGIDYIGSYDPERYFHEESSPEHQLKNLSKVLSGGINFIILDGNHNHDYLMEELRQADLLLKPNGLIILDDVHESWPAIKSIFDHMSIEGKYEKVGYDGRIGIIRRIGGVD
ncbi:MAG: class I SAM-dependent methyltransferase [Bacteroidetes bacterium]|nr:class I SAM-dependent methyltransferase [Bacteroidota bacterium]